MVDLLRPRIPAVVVLAGTVVAVALIVVSSLRYPAIFRLSGAGVVLTLTVVMLLGYAACGVWSLRRPAAGYQTGATWGALAGAIWSAEIWCGGPAKLSYPVEQALGTTFVLMAVVATITAGIVAAVRTRRAAVTWPAGLFSGLVSGVLLYAFAVIMTLSTLPILASRSDYQAQFARSHAPNMAAYLVGDMLAGAAAHLAINLILGLLGGGIGAAAVSTVPFSVRPRSRRRPG